MVHFFSDSPKSTAGGLIVGSLFTEYIEMNFGAISMWVDAYGRFVTNTLYDSISDAGLSWFALCKGIPCINDAKHVLKGSVFIHTFTNNEYPCFSISSYVNSLPWHATENNVIQKGQTSEQQQRNETLKLTISRPTPLITKKWRLLSALVCKNFPGTEEDRVLAIWTILCNPVGPANPVVLRSPCLVLQSLSYTLFSPL